MAQDGGVLVRAGHTEAGCDLARLAGLTPAAVICEIMKDDGTMARLPDLIEFAAQHSLKIGTIADLIHYRSRTESLVERVAERDDRDRARRVPARRLPRPAIGRDAPRAGARASSTPATEMLVRVHEPLSVMDLLDAGSAAHSWTSQRGARARSQQAERGVVVLLHRPRERRTSCSRALRPHGGRRRVAAEDGPAHLRHRRADPARPRRGEDGLLAQAAQDAEHGRLRPRSHRLSVPEKSAGLP